MKPIHRRVLKPDRDPARGRGVPPKKRVTSFPWQEESMAEHPVAPEFELPLHPEARPEMIDTWTQLRDGPRAVPQIILRTPDSVEPLRTFYFEHLPEAKLFPAQPEDQSDTAATLVYGPPGQKRVVRIYRYQRDEETKVSAHWLKDCDMTLPE